MHPSLKTILEQKVLPHVEKPMRYVGNELNCIRKELTPAMLHGVLCFPELYDIGMSHFGLQILYHVVNAHPTWALSRAFHPWVDAEAIMRNEGVPLYTMEYMTPVSQADFLGFSVQYELQYTNIVNMLDLAGLKVYAKDRTNVQPIVIAGGPCMINPEPLADFIDAFVIGDGEESLPLICTELQECKNASVPKSEILMRLSRLPGVYVPSLRPVHKTGHFVVPQGTPVNAVKINGLSPQYYPDKQLVPLIDVVHHRLAVEVMRGCTRGCRFCSAGSYYRPVRERNAADILATISNSIAATGWRDVGLLSLSTADYSGFDDLLSGLTALKHESHVAYSLPSTRIDALRTDQLDSLCALSNQSSFTIAPEAGSERLRRVINKGFTDDHIFEAVDLLLSRKIQTLKLYFMIGLPTETDADIDSMIGLIENIAKRVRQRSNRGVVNVSISPFSPKAQTPFQWEAMRSAEYLTTTGRRIKQGLQTARNVKVSYRDSLTTWLETFLARGDRTLGAVIHAAWSKGAHFDGWEEHFSVERWQQAAHDCNVETGCFTGELTVEKPLPWSIINCGVSQDFLRCERDLAYSGAATPDCRTGVCSGCGACDLAPRSLVNKGPIVIESIKRALVDETKSDPKAVVFYRCEYIKGDGVRFLGHRDMVNVFHRAFVAAKIPLAFSQGFHPHPRVAFGPPLPVGITGQKELLDIVTTRPITIPAATINQWLPDGLQIVNIEDLKQRPEALNAAVAAGVYTIVPLFACEKADCLQRIESCMALENVLVDVVSKETGQIKQRNIRPLIESLNCHVDIAGTLIIDVRLAITVSQSGKPFDIIVVLFPEKNTSDFIIERRELVLKV